MELDNLTDGENDLQFDIDELRSADMDDIHDLISDRIQDMISAEIKELDLPFDIKGFYINVDSLDISVNLDLEKVEEDD